MFEFLRVRNPFTPGRKISVTADSIICRTSDVDIAKRSCDLTFAAGKRTVTGSEATKSVQLRPQQAVPPGALPDQLYKAWPTLVCTIDPAEIMHKAGDGAGCTFETQ
jgi:hypothetical protein